jgi:hypothetical protein
MSIDDTNGKKVRPDRSSCRREASSDQAGAGADERANFQRKWRFANALPEPDFKYRSNAIARRSSGT